MEPREFSEGISKVEIGIYIETKQVEEVFGNLKEVLEWTSEGRIIDVSVALKFKWIGSAQG